MGPVSVVIPTYNGHTFVGSAIESVLAQTLLPQEIIVVDDCSTDPTSGLISSMAATAPIPLRLIRLDKNSGGPAHPINIGIQAAAGEYIAVLDQDDILLPDKLKDQTRVLDRHREIAFVFSFCAIHGKPEGISGHPHALQDNWFPNSALEDLRNAGEGKEDFRLIPSSAALRLFILHGQYAAGYPGFLFRRESWLRKEGVDEDLGISSDYDFVCWLCTQGAVGFLDRIHYLRREHVSNLCSNYRGRMYLESARIQARYLTQERWLLEDDEFVQQLQSQIVRWASWLIQEGNYADALRCYWIAGQILGWNDALRLGVVDLLPVAIYLEPPHAQFIRKLARS